MESKLSISIKLVIMKMKNTAILILLTSLFISCEDFLSGPLLDQNPNEVDDVSVVSPEALLVGSQVTMYGVMEGYLNRAVSMVMQQMSGLQTDYYRDYNCEPIDVNTNGRWTAMYGTGGLIDMNTTQRVANEQEKFILLAISQMWEALIFSTAADLWGKIPYSQAANSEFSQPKFDTQQEVHFAILDLIDEAIENFEKGQVFALPTAYDFSFGANTEKWIAAAHTLKSRIYLNWAETNNEYYQLALQEAELGIIDMSGQGDWKALHSAAIAERSVWFQFILSNTDYMGAGKLLVDMLERDNDSRSSIYFLNSSSDGIVGVSPGDSVQNASMLNITGHFGMNWSPEFLSWYENNFILAECHFNLGNQDQALTILNETLNGIEQRWRSLGYANATIPRYDDISNNDLLEAIMNEKYKALFLNIQTWSDWRRTGYPKFTDSQNNSTECGSTSNGVGVPRRLLYPEKEKSSNPNCPTGDDIYDRVENDPF
tara:strand:- start:1343 stop:2800 length:1458 start_codon:yes stop_codon:yes gene_type:complete